MMKSIKNPFPTEPKYKNLKFKKKADFDEWLEKTAKYKLEFEDHGQDFLYWWLDECGEVLHCEPFQASVWNGKMVDVEWAREEKEVILSNGDIMNYKAKEVVELRGD